MRVKLIVDGKKKARVSVKEQNQCKRAPRTQPEHIQYQGLQLVNYTVAMIPLINVSTHVYPSLHSYFVWGYGEWRRTQEG